VTKAGNANAAEIHNQALMMLAHEIDPETNKRPGVDDAFILAGGGITKAAVTGSVMRSTLGSGVRSC
jgi:hypothetical protein